MSDMRYWITLPNCHLEIRILWIIRNMFSTKYIPRFPSNIATYWCTIATILLASTSDVTLSVLAGVFLESPGMVWVKQNGDATIRWQANDTDLTEAAVDVYSGTEKVFHWPPNTDQPGFYSESDEARYSALSRNSTMLSFLVRGITVADMGKTFKCKLLHNGVSYTGRQTVIVVDAAPSQPRVDASPEFPVREGSSVSLTCSSTSDPSLAPYSQGLVYEWTFPPDEEIIGIKRYTFKVEPRHNNTIITCKVREHLSDRYVLGNIVVKVRQSNTGSVPTATTPTILLTTLADSGINAPRSTGGISARDTTIVITTEGVGMPINQKPERNLEREIMYGIIGALVGLFLLIILMATAFVCWFRRGRSKPWSVPPDNVPTLRTDKELPSPMPSIISSQQVFPSALCIHQDHLEAEDLADDYTLLSDVRRGSLPHVPNSNTPVVTFSLRQKTSERQLLDGLVYCNTSSSKNLAESERERRDSFPSESTSYSEDQVTHAQDLRMNISNTCSLESMESETVPNIDGQLNLSHGRCTTTMDSPLDETCMKSVVQSLVENDNPYTSTPHGTLGHDLDSVDSQIISSHIDLSVC